MLLAISSFSFHDTLKPQASEMPASFMINLKTQREEGRLTLCLWPKTALGETGVLHPFKDTLILPCYSHNKHGVPPKRRVHIPIWSPPNCLSVTILLELETPNGISALILFHVAFGGTSICMRLKGLLLSLIPPDLSAS